MATEDTTDRRFFWNWWTVFGSRFSAGTTTQELGFTESCRNCSFTSSWNNGIHAAAHLQQHTETMEPSNLTLTHILSSFRASPSSSPAPTASQTFASITTRITKVTSATQCPSPMRTTQQPLLHYNHAYQNETFQNWVGHNRAGSLRVFHNDTHPSCTQHKYIWFN